MPRQGRRGKDYMRHGRRIYSGFVKHRNPKKHNFVQNLGCEA
ncbi:Hypothetical protein EUBREC_3098 [Agathobacter rectalis ATCC 33656]|uniref:Uncharacterized protein n=1 Tax=Agathobacter rectalis (strain ATCC 33656 / DSM 3377 / JCM 17463 / KCTC 5835 / VPI 0990) TaxID=515619 RepID=C4Z8J9_AGARV|nr:Hypothetical protein EUBREC_3098 [Agathobacter rectalis ATCC 33656]